MKWPMVLAALLAAAPARAADPGRASTVANSKHNLSASGPGSIKAVSETRICVFCHVTHHAADVHGSNRPAPASQFQIYESSTLAAVPGAPSGATRICLSCHDGTVALGQTIASGGIALRNTGPGGRMPEGKSRIGTDLRRTHPVSIEPKLKPGLRRPTARDAVHLDGAGAVQCTSCHDPHSEDIDSVERKFLVGSNRNSALCLGCHELPTWRPGTSSHATSTKAYGPAEGSPTRYATVAETGCAACHAQHGGDERGRLLRRNPKEGDDAACLGCHDGKVARLDVKRDVSKPYAHAAPASGPSGHDAAEGPQNATFRLPESKSTAARHVSCVDCHDPHGASAQPAFGARVSGALAGVWGIDRNGRRVEPVQYQYEVCFKCHGDSANEPQGQGPFPPETLRRALPDHDLRRVFDLTSPSAHPVEGPGRNPDVPSLVAPLTTQSIIACTDCHASDASPAPSSAPLAAPAVPAVSTATVARGPHGSIYLHLLERPLETADHTPESEIAYALCYKCHDRKVVLSDRSSFNLHSLHVVGRLPGDGAPCTACHASHGVSPIQGNPVNNAHLVDFDVSIVKRGKVGVIRYTSAGYRSGGCALSCHGVDHDDTFTYAPGKAPLPVQSPALRTSIRR